MSGNLPPLPPIHPQAKVICFLAVLERVARLHDRGDTGPADELRRGLERVTRQRIELVQVDGETGFSLPDHPVPAAGVATLVKNLGLSYGPLNPE